MNELHLICRVAETEYAIPAHDVFQMEAYSSEASATPVPGAPSYIAGLVQIRGRIVPVLDLRVRFGLPAVSSTLASRIVVIKIGDHLVGILVDSAREVQNISHEQFKSPPDVVAAQSAGFIKSVAQLKDRIIMLLDSEKVIGEEVTRG